MSEQDGFSGISDIVHLGDEEATVRLLSQAVLGLWEVVNNLTRLRPTRSLRYRVTIFGSARTESGHWAYATVRDLAAELTRLGCNIVTGGGPGLMQAANEGARIAGAEPERSSVGIRVDLPFEQDVNPFVGEVYEHRTFFSRLHHFVLVSNAFVVVPGGIGTLLETMMIWQLLQVPRSPRRPRPHCELSSRWRDRLDGPTAVRPRRGRIIGALDPRRAKPTGWLALGLACAWAAISGCSPRAAADRVSPPPVVSVVEARRMTVPVMAEPIGTTTALQEVSIRARVRGFLRESHFKEGADVKAGQLLFVIDEEPFKAKLAEAQAALQQAEAALKKARESKAREVAAAQLDVGRTMMALSEIEERREQALSKRNASTQEEVQRKQALHQRDAAQVEAEKASLDQAKADFETQIAAAQADVAGAKARVADAQIDLSYCRMSSPIDGRAGLAKVKLGNLVGPATGGGIGDYTELLVVRQLDPMGVDMTVSSRYLDRIARLISQGLPIEIFRPGIEGDEAHRFPGKATVIDNTINPTSSTFLVRAEVANAAKTILPGEYVKGYARVGEVRDAIVVPEQAVLETQAGPIVYTVDKQGKVATVPVRASFAHEGLRVLESGLQPGQEVIVEGLQLVRAGMTVKTRPASLDASTASERPAGTKPDENAEPAGGQKPAP